MTTSIYIHNKTNEEYELLDSNVINKDTDKRMCLYCQKGKPTQWYVRSIEYFQKQFTLIR